MDSLVYQPLLKEESVESWSTSKAADEPSSTTQQECRPATVPQPRNELSSFLLISTPPVPSPDCTREPVNHTWQDKEVNSQIHYSELHPRCFTADVPTRSSQAGAKPSQQVAAIDWFLPLQAPPPRKSLLPPRLQPIQPQFREDNTQAASKPHKQYVHTSDEAGKPPSPFVVTSRLTTHSEPLQNRPRATLVPPQTAPVSHSQSPERLPIATKSTPPATPSQYAYSRSCLTAPNFNPNNDSVWAFSQSASMRQRLPSDLVPVSEHGAQTAVPHHCTAERDIPTDVTPWEGEAKEGELEFEDSTENACIVLNNGAPSKGMVLDARRAMTPRLMAAVLASAQQMTPGDIAVENMTIEAHAAEMQRQDALPWAAALVAKAWKRFMLRRRLLKWITMRRRIRTLFIRPYWHMWQVYASVERRSSMARKRAVLRAWNNYCDDMNHLHKAVIMWTASLVSTWQDTHLTWALCKKPGPEDGQRLLSTMLVSILHTHYVWHRKKHFFRVWSKYASGRRDKLMAIRNRLGQTLRRRVLQRLRPAFKFWHRVAVYKRKERAQGAMCGSHATCVEGDAPEWLEWVHMREHRRRQEQRAHRHRAHFLASYFLHYWRFFLARNKQLRAAWAFAARDRTVLLKWMTLIAFKMLRQIAQRERDTRRKVLIHWHAVMRQTSETRHLSLAQLVVDRKKLKTAALQSLQDHARAMRAMRVAGMLQLQQRPLPVLTAIAAWSNQHHELWKVLAWNAWRGYCMRRIRFKTLCGFMTCRPEALLLRRALCAWLQATSRSRSDKLKDLDTEAASASSALSSEDRTSGEAAVEDAPHMRSRFWSDSADIKDALDSGIIETLGEHVDAREGQIDAVEAPQPPTVQTRPQTRPLPEISIMPPLWKEPLQRRIIMAPAAQAISPRKLASRVYKMMSLRATANSGPLLPSIYETAPTAEGYELMQSGRRGILAVAASSMNETATGQSCMQSRDTPLGPLWRLLVAARVAAVPCTHDPSVLTYVATPSGMKGLHSTFSSHKGCSLKCTDYELEGARNHQECSEVDNYVERHAAGIAFLHRFAAAEHYLEAKAHALLGIGAEHSDNLYSILRERFGPHVGGMQAHVLSSLLLPLVDSDCSRLMPQRHAWLQRDRLFATRLLLRHLAAAVNREMPKFTLVATRGSDETKWKTITAYEDSSSDEEGPGGSSIYWTLPVNYRSEYKPTVRAMRRARHRHAYLTQLQRRGVLTVDVHPSVVKLLKVAQRGHCKGRKQSACDANKKAPHDLVSIPHGMQPLPYALATPGALEALRWLAKAVQKGRCKGVQWSSGLLSMLIADTSDLNSARSGAADQDRTIDELPDAYSNLESQDDEQEEDAPEGMNPELQFNEDAFEGDTEATTGGKASAEASSCTLASTEPSVLSTESAPADAPLTGTVGDYVIKKVSCMASVVPTRSSIAAKASTQLKAKESKESIQHLRSSPVPQPSVPALLAATVASNAVPDLRASISKAQEPALQADVAPVDPRKSSFPATLASHAVSGGVHTNTVPLTILPGASESLPGPCTQSSITNGLSGSILAEGTSQELVQHSDSATRQAVAFEASGAKPQKIPRPASASAVATMVVPQATAARCEARRVRSARLAARRAGEWGSGTDEGLDETEQQRKDDMIARCQHLAASAVAEYAAASTPACAQEAEEHSSATQLKPPQPSGLEGIELAAALSHLSSQSARLDREDSLTAAYDLRAQDATQVTPPQSASSFNSQPQRLDEDSQWPTEASGDCSSGSSRRSSVHPSTVLLNASLFSTSQQAVHARSRPSTAPAISQDAAQLPKQRSLPICLLAGETVAVENPDSVASTSRPESTATSASWSTGKGKTGPGAADALSDNTLTRVPSGVSPTRALQGSRSSPLAPQSLHAVRRPMSAPLGSQVLPTVPEYDCGASHCMPMHVPLPVGPGSSLRGSSSRSASDLIGSERVSVSSLEQQTWDSYPGNIPDTPNAANDSTHIPATLQSPDSLLPTFSTSTPVHTSLAFHCGDISSHVSGSGSDQHQSMIAADSSQHHNTGEVGTGHNEPSRASRVPLPLDAAAAQLAASIWAALPEEHQVFQECSRLAEARRRALAGSLLGSNSPTTALSALVQPVIKHVEVMQGHDGCTPADDLETLHMLHVALRERVQRAPATRVWHLTARRRQRCAEPGEPREGTVRKPRRSQRTAAHQKADDCGSQGDSIICTGDNVQKLKKQSFSRLRSRKHAAAGHEPASRDLHSTLTASVLKDNSRQSGAHVQSEPVHMGTSHSQNTAPVGSLKRSYSCPPGKDFVRPGTAHTPHDRSTCLSHSVPPDHYSSHRDHLSCQYSDDMRRQERQMHTHAHTISQASGYAAQRLPPPQLRTPATSRSTAPHVQESDMVLGTPAPRAGRPAHCLPKHVRRLGGWERESERPSTVDLNPRKRIPRYLKAGSGHAAWKPDRGARSRTRVRSQPSGSRRSRSGRAASSSTSRSPTREKQTSTKRHRSSRRSSGRSQHGGTLASKRKRETFIFSKPSRLDSHISKHVARGRSELAGRWHAAVAEVTAACTSPEGSPHSRSRRADHRSFSPSRDSRSVSPSLWGGSMTRSRSNSPVLTDGRDGQHGSSRGAGVAPQSLMRQIVSDQTAFTQDDCTSMDPCTPGPVLSLAASNDAEVWMALDDEEQEDAAGQFLEKLIDQKAQMSNLHFQTVVESVAAGVEKDVSASIGRLENYGVLVGAAPLGVSFKPLKKLRIQSPRLGLKPSARKLHKSPSSKALSPIRVPTLPKGPMGGAACREEALMDGVGAMIPQSPSAASGLITHGTASPAGGQAQEYGKKDDNNELPASGWASEAHTADPSTLHNTNTAVDQATQQRREKQVLEERAAVTALARAAAARRRELRHRNDAAYRAQQRRQWREGGILASKDIVWEHSVIETAAGNIVRKPCGSRPAGGNVAALSAGHSSASSVLPPAKRATSKQYGNVFTGPAICPPVSVAPGHTFSAAHARSTPSTPFASTQALQHLPSVSRPVTAPTNTGNVRPMLSHRWPKAPAHTSMPHAQGHHSAVEDNPSSEMSPTVVAATGSVLRACVIAPPILNSVYGKSRKRVPKVRQSWMAPRVAKPCSHHSLARLAASQHTLDSSMAALPSGNEAGKLKPGSQKPLYASGDAPGQVTVCDIRSQAAGMTASCPVTACGKQLPESAARGTQPLRVSDLHAGVSASHHSTEALSWQATDVRLRLRVPAPLGGIVPPSGTHSGRQKLKPHKYRKAVNYTMYNDQRFAEAEQRKKDAAAKKAQAKAAAQAALTEQMR